MEDTLRSQTVSTTLQQIAEQASLRPEMVFTTLIHHVDTAFLRQAYESTRKDGAPGLDGITGKQYSENLDTKLIDLHERLKSGRYRAPFIRRTWIDKEGGKKRPLGIPEFEDKIVQKAISMLLGAVYEEDFHDFSYGYRTCKSPHQAIGELREGIMNENLKWIIDADISGFFDNIDHGLMRQILKRRVNDGGVIKLIGKWLKAGIVDGRELSYPEMGTPQGGVISPTLANIYLHHVLDDWFIKEVKPKMKGRIIIVRFADDFVLAIELEEDARTLMRLLPERFRQFGLELNQTKTKLVEFQWDSRRNHPGKGEGTFDFLGFTFYWDKSRQGNWIVKKRTAGKRLRRSMKALWAWCKENRHEPIPKQHRTICQKLRGHFQYFGVICNYRKLESYLEHARRTWRYWLSQRGERKMISWEKYEKMLEIYPLPVPRIVHQV